MAVTPVAKRAKPREPPRVAVEGSVRSVEWFIDGSTWFGRMLPQIQGDHRWRKKDPHAGPAKDLGSGPIGRLQIADCKMQIANLGGAGGHLMGAHIVDIYKYKNVRKCNFRIEEADLRDGNGLLR